MSAARWVEHWGFCNNPTCGVILPDGAEFCEAHAEQESGGSEGGAA